MSFDVKKALLHDTELAIRTINRRLESYGKHSFVPPVSKTGNKMHTYQYEDILNKIAHVVMRADRNLKSPVLGTKGEYVQISRSKDVINELSKQYSVLKKIAEQIPTFKDELDKARGVGGNNKPLSRKEGIKEMQLETFAKKFKTIEYFLDNSDPVEWEKIDPQIIELLKPFRSPQKGGTRSGLVSPSDFKALQDYLEKDINFSKILSLL